MLASNSLLLLYKPDDRSHSWSGWREGQDEVIYSIYAFMKWIFIQFSWWPTFVFIWTCIYLHLHLNLYSPINWGKEEEARPVDAIVTVGQQSATCTTIETNNHYNHNNNCLEYVLVWGLYTSAAGHQIGACAVHRLSKSRLRVFIMVLNAYYITPHSQLNLELPIAIDCP